MADDVVLEDVSPKSGGGWQQLMSPWGKVAKGGKTRLRKKLSNRFILVRRDGRPMKLS